MVLDPTPKPPPSFFPHHLPHANQLQGWFLARPKAVFSSPSTLIPLSRLAQMAAPHRSDIDVKLIVTVSKGSVSPFYTLPNKPSATCSSLRVPGLLSPRCCLGYGGEEGFSSAPHLKNCIHPTRMVACGCWS